MFFLFSCCARVSPLTLAFSSSIKVRRRRSASLARMAPCCATTRVTSCSAFSRRSSLSVIFWSICRCSACICLTASALKARPQPCLRILGGAGGGDGRCRRPAYLSQSLLLHSSIFCTHSLFSSQSLSRVSRLNLSCSSAQENSASTRSLCGESRVSLSGCTYRKHLEGLHY